MKRKLTKVEQDLIKSSNDMIRAGKLVLADPNIPSRIKTMVNIEMICHRECLATVGMKLDQ
jgi:2,4-dienoyl-CoA reductase-like NADH-dependent reductase (Old Yellow Enzyme family)